MKLTQLLSLAIVLTFSSASTFSRTAVHAASQHSELNHAAQSHTNMTLNEGKKWHTDENLRNAMSNIQANVTSALASIHAGKLSSAQYDALGKEIWEQISFIVTNCKLDPKADEQLHLIITGIADGIDTANAKTEHEKRVSGIHKIAESLNNYGKYFEHPNWQTLKLDQY